MKKIPTLFLKQYDTNGRYTGVSAEWNFDVENLQAHIENNFKNVVPTIKYDGTACMILDDKIYRRWDNKKNKVVPDGSVLCDSHLPPHEIWWVLCKEENPQDRYHIKAMHELLACDYLFEEGLSTYGTYELIGKHFQGNPYNLDTDVLISHGFNRISNLKIDFTSLKQWCKDNNEEGLVFWETDDNGILVNPIAKIRRRDFGFPWN